ncbi:MULTISPECIES: RNA polymerase alpha subunit C-terminal domain-containing protein [Paenibacillus]|uniref:RNA polymerase alpha subunit C-terminal domain-containing protein n=1 Tax=Paenibacillus lignilyticus TaxID=1172615 RepID=A0ABS5CJL9_9BACL|nr:MULTISPECIES: RNA polymerase alpha subunit C-terminal domain-containing protein [Paenibacillus]MBP3966061.1 RNA polymerase alpha subunit C-terminal domain-containing protein [Paenibacillus lignilyticus]SFT27026.1 RNA polymerase, alpha chain C terminal domain [Paenibacillus sp. BC26]
MATTEKSLRTCKKGHQYYKSTDCPTCPTCEQEKKPESGFLSQLSAPARRALEHNGITTLEQLSQYREADILKFHGMGPGSMPKLRAALEANGLSFKQ